MLKQTVLSSIIILSISSAAHAGSLAYVGGNLEIVGKLNRQINGSSNLLLVTAVI